MAQPLGIIPADRCGIAWLHRGRGRRIGRHRHAELELNHAVGGRAAYRVGDRRVELEAHSQLWLFPEQDHVLIEASDDFAMWIACWAPEYVTASCTSAASAVLCQADPGGVLTRCIRPDLSRRLVALLGEANTHPDPAARDAAIGYSLHLAWAQFGQSRELPRTRALHPAVERAVRYLAEDDAGRSVSELASRCGISASRLGELFREQLGISPVALRNRYRIDAFLERFGDGSERTVSAAALEAGFGSYPQFHRVFKQVMGYGPAEHRRRVRQS